MSSGSPKNSYTNKGGRGVLPSRGAVAELAADADSSGCEIRMPLQEATPAQTISPPRADRTMSIQKWIHRSTLLLLTVTLALLAFGLASGKITQVSFQIHHVSAPDIDLRIGGESGSRSPNPHPQGPMHKQHQSCVRGGR